LAVTEMKKTSEVPTGPTSAQVSSRADAALVADRRRQAALRLVRDAEADAALIDDRREHAETPLFEARTSAIGGDVDAAGNRLIVWPDRVELRDRHDRARAVIPVDAIDQVEVRKRLTSATLTVTGTGGESLVLKGVKPASAARFRDTVAGLKLPSPSESATPTSEALRRLDELAAMGLLTEREVAEKRSLLAQQSARRRA